MDKHQCLDALSALAHETRLDAFRLLVEVEPVGLNAGEIADRLGVRQNTLSANLLILSRAGLVRQRREGRNIRYFAQLSQMRGFLSYLLQDCCGGRPDKCAPLLDEAICAAGA